MSSITIDARDLLCPMPVIRTQNGIKDMAPGTQVEVLCTDPGAVHDIPAWCRVWGHEVRTIDEEDHLITITILVGGRA